MQTKKGMISNPVRNKFLSGANGVKIIVADNYQLMSELAAESVIKQIGLDKKTVLALPTGDTPVGLYKNLAVSVRQKKISFKLTTTFNLDEYVGLSGNDRRSYHVFMKKNLFDFIDIKRGNIFMLNGRAKDLKQECARYESLIKNHGGIDLLILGIGLDGHIAFNEPGSKFDSITRVIKLKGQTRRSNAKYFNGFDQVPRRALTIGLETIMKAGKIILMASGEKKAKIIKRALTGKITTVVPASILQNHKNLTVILDADAAKSLC